MSFLAKVASRPRTSAPAVTFVGVSSVGGSTCSVPAGTQDGDLLIAIDVDSYNYLVTLPSGWTRALADFNWVGLSGYASMCCYKVWHTGDPTSGITFSGGGASNVAIIAYRGPTGITAIGSWEEKTGTSMTFTGVSGTGTLVFLLTDRDGTVSLVKPASMTSRLDAGGATFRIAIADEDPNDAANKVWTCASSSYPCVGVGLILS